MNTNRKLRILITALPLFLAAGGASNAIAGGTLLALPPMPGDTTNDARAITPDGAFVVGMSGPSGAGFLYNVTNGYIVQPFSGNDGNLAQALTGVAYRIDTNQLPAQPQMVVSGFAGTPLTYTVWMTPDGGTNWDANSYHYSDTKKETLPLANGLAGTSWDLFSSAWTQTGPASGDNWQLVVGQFTGYWSPATVSWDIKGAAKPSLLLMSGVSSYGRAVGWRTNAGGFITYIVDYLPGPSTGDIWNCKGLDNTTFGQASCVNSNGTVIFGISPKTLVTAPTNFPFKATFDFTFPGSAANQLGVFALPNFADAIGTRDSITTTTNLAEVYGCDTYGKYAVGVSYRGREKAVLWDTSNADTNLWTITDLTDLAIANGLTDELTNLTRAYSIGINASGDKVIAGAGTDTNGYTRGFVLTVGQLAPPLVAAHITSIVSGASTCTINYNSGSGSQFVLLSSPLVTTHMSSWSRVATNFTGSGSFAPAKSGSQTFWRIKSE